jgi:hypothetical protein
VDFSKASTLKFLMDGWESAILVSGMRWTEAPKLLFKIASVPNGLKGRCFGEKMTKLVTKSQLTSHEIEQYPWSGYLRILRMLYSSGLDVRCNRRGVSSHDGGVDGAWCMTCR